MTGVRYSLYDLLKAVALVAICAAVLRHASPFWSRATFTVAVCLVGIGVLAALFGRGNMRAMAGGFALCTATYLTLTLTTAIHNKLLTTDVFNALYPQLQWIVPPPPIDDSSSVILWQKGNGEVWAQGESFREEQIAEELSNLIGNLGGQPVRVFFDPGISLHRRDLLIDALIDLGANKIRSSENRIAPDKTSFVDVCHYLTSILVGIVGGAIAAVCYTKTRAKAREQ